MNLGIFGDNIYTETIVQTAKDGSTEIFVKLTPEFIEWLDEIEEKIEKIERYLILQDKTIPRLRHE